MSSIIITQENFKSFAKRLQQALKSNVLSLSTAEPSVIASLSKSKSKPETGVGLAQSQSLLAKTFGFKNTVEALRALSDDIKEDSHAATSPAVLPATRATQNQQVLPSSSASLDVDTLFVGLAAAKDKVLQSLIEKIRNHRFGDNILNICLNMANESNGYTLTATVLCEPSEKKAAENVAWLKETGQDLVAQKLVLKIRLPASKFAKGQPEVFMNNKHSASRMKPVVFTPEDLLFFDELFQEYFTPSKKNMTSSVLGIENNIFRCFTFYQTQEYREDILNYLHFYAKDANCLDAYLDWKKAGCPEKFQITPDEKPKKKLKP